MKHCCNWMWGIVVPGRADPLGPPNLPVRRAKPEVCTADSPVAPNPERRLIPVLVLLLSAATAGMTSAAEPEVSEASPWTLLFRSSTVSLYSENDRYFAGTDHHYTNGLKLSFMGETNLRESPRFVQEIANLLPTLTQSAAARHEYVVGVAFGQNIYTPTDTYTPTPDPLDRPYAGWLYGSLAFQMRDERRDMLRTVELSLGVVGPSALGRQAQNGWHDVIDVPHSQGWDHQLRDEPGLVISWERRHRLFELAPSGRYPGADFIGRYSLSLGNVDTSARGGLMFRIGWGLPLDFGPDLIRAAAGEADRFTKPTLYFFGGAEVRGVFRNIFLDGNTWRASPSVDKRPLVGDFSAGVVGRFPALLGGMQITYTQDFRTKEFYGQAKRDVFGSVSVSWLH